MSEVSSALWRDLKRARRLLIAAIIVPLLAGCSGGSKPEAEPAPDAPANDAAGVTQFTPEPDPDFMKAVFADGTVTRDEFDQAVAHYADCMIDGGLEGAIWVAPEFGRTSPAVRLSLVDEPEQHDPEGSPIAQVSEACSGAYMYEVSAAYTQGNPPTPEQEARMFDRALACLEGEAPELAAQVSDDWDYRALREWWATEGPEDLDREMTLAGQECVVYLGIPFRDLGDW